MKTPGRLSLAVLFLLLCGVSFILLYSLAAPTYQTGIRNAEAIIKALEEYEDGHGQYPWNMVYLVSGGYLDKILNANWRYSYQYFGAGSRYTLSFKTIGGDFFYQYDSDSKQWNRCESAC